MWKGLRSIFIEQAKSLHLDLRNQKSLIYTISYPRWSVSSNDTFKAIPFHLSVVVVVGSGRWVVVGVVVSGKVR